MPPTSHLLREPETTIDLGLTLQGTITSQSAFLSRWVFLLPRWDMLVSSRVRAKDLKIGGLPQKQAGLFPNVPPFFRVEVLALGSVDRLQKHTSKKGEPAPFF